MITSSLLTKSLLEENIDILILTEIKTDARFPNSQFIIHNSPFRHDRNTFGGGVLIYIRDDVPCEELNEHKFPVDIEGIFIEINLESIFLLTNQMIFLFFENVGKAFDIYSQKYDKFLLCGGFNSESRLSKVLLKYVSKNLVLKKTVLKTEKITDALMFF